MQRATRTTGGTAALPSSVAPQPSATNNNNSAAAPAVSAGSWAFATRRGGSGGNGGSAMANTTSVTSATRQHPLAPSTAANTTYNTSSNGKDYSQSGSGTIKRTASQHNSAEASIPAAQTTATQQSSNSTSQTAAANATSNSTSSSAVQGPWDAGMGRQSYIVRGNKFELPNEYKVSKCIGTGAYGTVCAGTRNGQPVAVKRCPNLFKNLDDGKRVLREIKLLQFFHHDNVLSLKDLMPPRDRHRFNDVYMVTDLMNADLGKVLRSSQALTEEHCQYFMYQMLRGLKHIHSANVMHRDLKPANVLVNWNCDMKLCDFGLSRGFDPEKAQDMTGYVVTRYYRPPELLMMCTQYTPAVDVWSAGCIFAEILNRRPLFKGKSYIHELSLVCDALGTPKEADLGWLSDPAALRYVKGLESRPGRPIEELVPKLAGNTMARDFLCKMLVFDPTKRSSVPELLSHPYLAHLHDPSTEMDANSTFSWEHDRRSLKETELRNLFWDEICVFHPELDSVDAPCTNVY